MSGSARKEPQKGGARRKAGPHGRAGAHSAAELEQALADKDRQLRDLTEQSLGFLEELAELRRRESDRQRIAARLGELERMLEDFRRRLRGAGVRVPEGAPADAPPFQLVFWGPGGADPAQLMAATLPPGSVVWVGPVNDLPADSADADRVQWVTAKQARTPAQCWNLGMATTRAPWVVFLAAGARPEGEIDLPDQEDLRRVALLQPRLLRGESVELGFHEPGGMLRLEPLPAAKIGTSSHVPFASPEGFLVRRAAFESLGHFDEGLLGPLALADLALRARATGFEVRAEVDLEIRVREEGLQEPGENDERDLLLLLARHRPTELGRALGDLPVLWELERAEIPAFVSEMFARATGRPLAGGQGDLVAAIAAAMVQQTVPGGRTVEALHEHSSALRRVLGVEPSAAPASLDQVMAELAETLGIATERLERAHGLEARSEQAEARAAEAERERRAVEERMQSLQKEFQAIATAVNLVREPQPARVRERLLEMKAEAEQLTRVLEAAGAPDSGTLIQSLYDVRQRLAEAQTLVHERNRWIALLLREVCRRRLFPRRLQEHEKAFLDKMDPSP